MLKLVGAFIIAMMLMAAAAALREPPRRAAADGGWSCSGKLFKEDAQGHQEFKLTCK